MRTLCHLNTILVKYAIGSSQILIEACLFGLVFIFCSENGERAA